MRRDQYGLPKRTMLTRRFCVFDAVVFGVFVLVVVWMNYQTLFK